MVGFRCFIRMNVIDGNCIFMNSKYQVALILENDDHRAKFHKWISRILEKN